MSTSYNTLTLGEAPVERKRTRMATIVVAGLSLVAFAGAAAFVGRTVFSAGAHVTDAAYQALDATPVNCRKETSGYADDLPKWDPNFSDQEGFYNACYYSFRCCTTTGNGDGCYVSDNFGASCRTCLKSHGPKMVKGKCAKWVDLPKDERDIDWGVKDLVNDKPPPKTSKPLFAVEFNNYKRPTCWQQRGDTDKMVVAYADKCFEVLSWCNLLCPRDTPQTVDHVMCKHCTLFGFQDGYWDADNFDKAVMGIGK